MSEKLELEQKESGIITWCALRFDGYKYLDHAQLGTIRFPEWGGGFQRVIDLEEETGRFFEEQDLEQPMEYLCLMFFLIQREFIKEGRLDWESRLGSLTRKLFLKLCSYEIPEQFRIDWTYHKWMQEYRPALKEHIAFVEGRHRSTVYSDKLFRWE